MSSFSSSSLTQIPQTTDIWYCATAMMRAWVTQENSAPVRPYVILIMDLRTNLILNADLKDHIPGAEEVKTALLTAMQTTKVTGMTPHRPLRIDFEDRAMQKSLSLALEEIGVRAKYGPHTEELSALVREMETHMNGGEQDVPGLLSQPKVSPGMVGSLFRAAANFYRAAPWVQLGNDDPLEIQVSGRKEPRFFTVMGQGGVEYGLAQYQTMNDLERQYLRTGDPIHSIPSHGIHSFMFNSMTEIPFDDLDAVERYGWEIAGPEAYPFPAIFLPNGNLQRPDCQEILWYEAVLRAIPLFVQRHLEKDQAGDILPIEATIQVPTSSGMLDVNVRYPVAGLHLAEKQVNHPYREEDGRERGFDRRAMEGDIARFVKTIGDMTIDPKLKEAQELIYDAWEESSSRRRVALANKALTISKDCADAYVILAEEQARNLQGALDYYEQGIAAGKHALGEEYLIENAGRFWSLFETRPYMRCMEGKARCLWQLRRKEESLNVYEEMLRLNPDDNQGIRYVLCDLYLEINKESELRKLLKDFGDEWSAVWQYTQALLAFRVGGATTKANRALQQALKCNPNVPAYLTGDKRIPLKLPDTIGMGDENEAISYAADHINYWRQTPGALDWLQEQLSSMNVPSSVKPGNKRRGRNARSLGSQR